MENAYPSVRCAFVRHGQARAADDSYDQHTPLSPLGRRQATSTAEALLKRDPPQAIYSSPYPRCVETAWPLCEALGLSPILDARLGEFEFENQTLASAMARPDLVFWDSTHRGRPDGETLKEFSARIAACLQEIAERHLGCAVALFTHSGLIDAAIRWFMGLPSSRATRNRSSRPSRRGGRNCSRWRRRRSSPASRGAGCRRSSGPERQ